MSPVSVLVLILMALILLLTLVIEHLLCERECLNKEIT